MEALCCEIAWDGWMGRVLLLTVTITRAPAVLPRMNMLFIMLCLMKIRLSPSGEGQGKNRRRSRRTSRSSDQDRRSTLQVLPCCRAFFCQTLCVLLIIVFQLYHFYFLSKSFKEVCLVQKRDSKITLKKTAQLFSQVCLAR